MTDDLFAFRLESFGDAPAVVIDGGETVSYRELAARADAFAARLGDVRRLVVVEGANRLEPLVAYLGALRARHPVVLTPPAMPEPAAFNAAYAPDFSFVQKGDGFELVEHRLAPRELHPDLTLLLSTSGTTGSSKLVRLSRGAVQANAASIAEYLELTAAEAPISSLPMHYSYGLSVVNSHLHCGARLLVTERSVVDQDFWTFAAREGATSMAGVPYTYEMLERLGFRDRDPGSVRTLTQAGGRLTPDLVRAYADWAKRNGGRFFVMYGQTEAAPRMAYLPPELCRDNPDAIGVAIPGGAFRLQDNSGATIERDGTVGELVYSGPNVMMGYAEKAADLARGAELSELRTGDLASRDRQGLYRIAGRMSRFAKVFGLRLNLDEVETALRDQGVVAAAASNDSLIAVGAVGRVPQATVDGLAARLKLPATTFRFVAYDELPTLPSGKIDYRRILGDAVAAAAKGGAVTAASAAERLQDAFTHCFHREVGPDESFVSLGGDSLNYVVLSLALEEALGFLPDAWEELSLAQLQAMAPQAESGGWFGLRKLETEVVIRAASITAVVVHHVSHLVVGGGAQVLLMLAGYNLARYQRQRLAAGEGVHIVTSFLYRILLPYYGIMLVYFAVKRHFDLPSLLLVSNYFGRFHSMLEPYWFLEALLQCLLLWVLLFRIPFVRRLGADRPWTLGLVLLGLGVAAKVAAGGSFDEVRLENRTAEAVFFLLALGWCLQLAKAPRQKVAVSVLAGGFAVLYLTHDRLWAGLPNPTAITHALWLSVSAFAILWAPRVPIPRLLHWGVTTVAAASFYIYLTHVFPVAVVYWALQQKGLALNLALALAVGIFVWAVVQRLDLSFESLKRRLGGKGQAADIRVASPSWRKMLGRPGRAAPERLP